ncbi:MAG: hypothetical protein ABII22_07160 [Candidatus Micrarchaeota archaeon]
MARRLERSILFRLENRLDAPHHFPGPTKEEIRGIMQIADKGSIKRLLKTYFDVDSPQREVAAKKLEDIIMRGKIPDCFRRELTEFVWDRGKELSNPEKARKRVGLADLTSSN